MTSSLGLAGDLDDVDLIRDIEAAFGFRFPDAELGNCSTVGDVFHLIEKRLPRANSDTRCATAMCFYRMRRALRDEVAGELRPTTPITVLNTLSVRKLREIILKNCGLRPPKPVVSTWGCLALVLTFALPIGAHAAGWSWWVTTCLSLTAFGLFKVAPVRLPNEVKTFGDLVRIVASSNIGKLADDGARLGHSEAWVALLDIISDHTVLAKDKVGPETLILAPKKTKNNPVFAS